MDLLMPFIEQSPIYVHGFEAGQIWEKAARREVFNNRLFHTQNWGQVRMICDTQQYTYQIERIDETWSSLSAEPMDNLN